MAHYVTVLDKDQSVGNWLLKQLNEINVQAHWVASVSELLAYSATEPPVVCLVALRAPVAQVLNLITDLSQEPRFARSSFIIMGPLQYKHAAFEAGADDYLVTPPDVIELRKRVRLYLDRAVLEARVMAETQIAQDIAALNESTITDSGPMDEETRTLLEHTTALTLERDRLIHVLNNTPVALALINAEGTVQFANPAWKALSGPTPESIPWPALHNQPTIAHALTEALQRGDPWQGDVRHAHPDGSVRQINLTLTPARAANDELIGFVVTQVDITAPTSSPDVRARFLADAAFEMRTPVSNIKMRQYLLGQAPTNQHAMHLTALERETDRLSRLVESMLELSRLDSSITRFDHKPVNLTQIAAQLVTRFSQAATEHGVTLAAEPATDLLIIQADPSYLARAMGVLIDNAIQHTAEGGHIAVSAFRTTRPEGALAAFQVKDTGMGIQPDALPHIFERFYRSDRVRDSNIRGVGLGLAIAQEIIQRHGGSITVESEVNHGSTFTIWLPLS